jgi:hypothetical protein
MYLDVQEWNRLYQHQSDLVLFKDFLTDQHDMRSINTSKEHQEKQTPYNVLAQHTFYLVEFC